MNQEGEEFLLEMKGSMHEGTGVVEGGGGREGKGPRAVKMERADFSRKRKHRLPRLEDKIYSCDQINLLSHHSLVIYLCAWWI